MSSVAALSAGFSVAGTITSAYDGYTFSGTSGHIIVVYFGYTGVVFGDSGSYHVQTNWYTPAVENIGNSYWAKATLVSGSVTVAFFPFGTIAKLDSAFGFDCRSPANPTAVIRVQIYSDSGGVTQVADGTITITTTP